jgi:hypothetical protein
MKYCMRLGTLATKSQEWMRKSPKRSSVGESTCARTTRTHVPQDAPNRAHYYKNTVDYSLFWGVAST